MHRPSFWLRLLLMMYSIWQDKHPVINFTDIDYMVFTDASSYISQGSSPYLRATYRYTPLLAMLLRPNLIFPLFGKLLFCFCDLMTGFYIEKILDRLNLDKRFHQIWTLNPFVAAISVRGNAESIMALLVMMFLWALVNNRWRWAAVVFGLAVHIKIYPIIYSIPIWFGIDHITTGVAYRWQLFSRKRVEFGLVAGSTVLLLNVIMYHL